MSFDLLERAAKAARRRGYSLTTVDARIQTDFLDGGKVQHTFSKTADEEWTNEKVLGRGGFGTVVLQKCTGGPRKMKGKLRAVKKISVGNSPSGNTQLLIERELQGLITFADPQVRAEYPLRLSHSSFANCQKLPVPTVFRQVSRLVLG